MHSPFVSGILGTTDTLQVRYMTMSMKIKSHKMLVTMLRIRDTFAEALRLIEETAETSMTTLYSELKKVVIR